MLSLLTPDILMQEGQQINLCMTLQASINYLVCLSVCHLSVCSFCLFVCLSDVSARGLGLLHQCTLLVPLILTMASRTVSLILVSIIHTLKIPKHY